MEIKPKTCGCNWHDIVFDVIREVAAQEADWRASFQNVNRIVELHPRYNARYGSGLSVSHATALSRIFQKIVPLLAVISELQKFRKIE